MEDQKVVSEITGDELAGALGVNASSELIGQLGMLVWPVRRAQSEAFMLMDERAAILADGKLTPEQRAAKLKPIEAALQRIVMDAVALTVLYSLPHLRLTTLSASAAKGVLSAGALKDFIHAESIACDYQPSPLIVAVDRRSRRARSCRWHACAMALNKGLDPAMAASGRHPPRLTTGSNRSPPSP